MITLIVKSFLITLLLILAIISSLSDIKSNVIPNKLVLVGMVGSIIGDVIYFYCLDFMGLIPFAINMLGAIVISFVMYAFHIWAAGDVKLFVLLMSLVPTEFSKQKSPLGVVTVFITVFSLAFLYLIIESVVLFIKKEKATTGFGIRLSFKSIVSCMTFITVIQAILKLIFGSYYFMYLPAFLLLNIILVLVFNKIKFLQTNVAFVVCLIIGIVSLLYSLFQQQLLVDVKSVILSLLVIGFRAVAERYNYQEIKTESVEKGMILAYSTVLQFSRSRVKGLPIITTEDMSSRITAEQADSIKRWGKSKNGKESIVILRKIPFAAFISLGYIIYLGLGVFVW